MYSSNSSNESLKCVDFTSYTAHVVLSAKMSFSTLAIILNLLVIVFIIYSKKFKDFLYRLILYLTITDVVQAVAIIIISLPVTMPEEPASPVRIKPGWRLACTASGYISMASLWMGNFIIFWIVTYLVWLGWCLYRHVYRKLERKGRGQNLSSKGMRRDINEHPCTIKEIIFVIGLFVIPFLIATIPIFIDEGDGPGGMYGLSGLWCWMKTFDKSCGDLGNLPLGLELAFFYAPLMLIVLLAILFIMVMFICCCRGEVRKHEKSVALKQRHIKEILIMLACPLLYCSVCLVLSINRIYSTVHESSRPNGPLWIAHAVADPIRIMLPPLALIINPYVWKDAGICSCQCCKGKQTDENSRSKADDKSPLPTDKEAINRHYCTFPNDEYVQSLISDDSD